MSATVLTDVTLLLGGYDLTNFSGEFDINVEAAMVEANNFGGKGFNIVLPGLNTATGMVKGHADYASGAVSATFNTASKGTQYAFGVLPTGSAHAAGDSAQFMEGRLGSMKMVTGSVGEVADFEMSLSGDSAEVDGYVGAALASRTTSGLTGTSLQLGAVPAGKRLWAAQFVTAAAGTNLATTIQSDNATGFPSQTTQITFSTVSATGWQFTSVAGPITDDWFRVVSTIASSTFTYAVLIGIQ